MRIRCAIAGLCSLLFVTSFLSTAGAQPPSCTDA